METLRDTAFGKLVRLFSRYTCMKYPEEQDASVRSEYLKTDIASKKEADEASTSQTDNESPEDLEAFGLYAVMSQCSTRTRRISTLKDGENNSQQAKLPLVISWRGILLLTSTLTVPHPRRTGPTRRPLPSATLALLLTSTSSSAKALPSSAFSLLSPSPWVSTPLPGPSKALRLFSLARS